MKNTIMLLVIVIVFAFSATWCFSEEKSDHICFRSIDANNDGKVTYEEFEKFFKNDRKKFDAIDMDKNGVLTHDEYHKQLGHGS